MNISIFRPTESFWTILGLLRFLLASIVFISHLHYFADPPLAFQYVSNLGGKAAVLGFLVISGISVGHSYTVSKKGFFKRRFLRIYPLYFAAVLLTIFLQFKFGSPYQAPNLTLLSAGWRTSLANLFFLQGFIAITIPFNGPLWSLGVEVFLYLLIPFLFRLPLAIYYSILIVSLAFFIFLQKDILLYGGIVLPYAWAWLVGFLISARNMLPISIGFLIVGVILVNINTYITGEPLSWLLFLLTSLVIVLTNGRNLNLSKFVTKLLNYLGDISYPLYVFHIPLYLIYYHLGMRNPFLFVVCLLLAIIPINFIFDNWLKKVFWKPVVLYLGRLVTFSDSGGSSRKQRKFTNKTI